ncbi:MAG TPA: cupin domain-containing protein [Gaiellaceae bacterium]|nr:cupin domain-containing protein [Gaiellaceae bacterium]
MIRPGEQLENPVTGEVMIFRETAAESGGELVRVETIVQPDGFVAAAHVHPAQTERFDVLEGTVEFRIGRDVIRASAGDEVVVPPGTPHRFRNDGDEAARFLVEVRPALKFESLIETMFTLAAEGKTGRRGLPGPFRLAVIAREHFDTVRLPFPPAPLQRAALAVGAPLGRALGYEPTVERPPTRADSRTARGRGYDRGRPHGSPQRRPT